VAVAAAVVVGLLGLGFVLIGLRLALAAGGGDVHYLRLFGVRDAFLGALTVALLVARERRALLLLLAGALVLPVADTVALAGPDGLAAAARANLPFEAPLVLAAALVAAWRPRRD
jgi:hypothetical protein